MAHAGGLANETGRTGDEDQWRRGGCEEVGLDENRWRKLRGWRVRIGEGHILCSDSLGGLVQSGKGARFEDVDPGKWVNDNSKGV